MIYNMWLFGFRKCCIIERYPDEQVRIELENGCQMVVFLSVVYGEEQYEKNSFTKSKS